MLFVIYLRFYKYIRILINTWEQLSIFFLDFLQGKWCFHHLNVSKNSFSPIVSYARLVRRKVRYNPRLGKKPQLRLVRFVAFSTHQKTNSRRAGQLFAGVNMKWRLLPSFKYHKCYKIYLILFTISFEFLLRTMFGMFTSNLK